MLNEGEAKARHAALICHPHPLYGGTVHNKVVYNTMKALNSFGFPCLRFNFRGAGLSEGQHDEGRGEVEDVKSAVRWLDQEFHRPIIFAGFSFGAATGMKATCPDDRVAGIISLGTPVAVEGRVYAYPFLAHCPKPKLFISGTQDQYGPVENLHKVFMSASQPKEIVLVEEGDHFFAGKLDQVQHAIERWIKRYFMDEAPSL